MISDRHIYPPDYCKACEKYHVYQDGLCWQCLAEYQRHESDFADTEQNQ